MFEHLGPLPDIQRKKRHWRHRFVVALFFSLSIFFLVLITTSGPSSLAANSDPRVRWQSNTAEQRVVSGTAPLQLFHLLIDSPVSGVALQKIRIYVNGLYEPEYLSNLKIYHQGIQIGSEINLDEDGYINLDLNDYKLPAGSSQLIFNLSDSSILKQGSVLQFSIENRKDIQLSYQNKKLLPGGKFPLVSGVTQIVDKGDWQIFNRTSQPEKTVPNQGRVLIGKVAFASGAEVLDLQRVVFGMESLEDSDLAGTEFILLNNGELIAKANNQDNKIIFESAKPLASKNNILNELELYAFDLPLGDYLFSLGSVSGKGYISNKEITWSGPMVLSRLHSLDNYPLFETGAIDYSLRVGWNNVYSLKVRPAKKEDVNIHKLTWYYKASNTKVRGAKIFIDHKYYPMDLVINDNNIIAKAEWSNPLPVTEGGLNIRLMLDLDQSHPDSTLEVYLQNDILAGDPDNIWDDKIIWSYNDKLNNSYLLPNLPLQPMVLDYVD